jgi:hypothetical protein
MLISHKETLMMDEPDADPQTHLDRARAYARELRQEADAVERCPELLSAAHLGDDLFEDTVQFLLQLDGWSGDLADLACELDDLD